VSEYSRASQFGWLMIAKHSMHEMATILACFHACHDELKNYQHRQSQTRRHCFSLQNHGAACYMQLCLQDVAHDIDFDATKHVLYS